MDRGVCIAYEHSQMSHTDQLHSNTSLKMSLVVSPVTVILDLIVFVTEQKVEIYI